MERYKGKLFVDSNFLISLANKEDSTHTKAKEINLRLEKENPRLVISSLILIEVVTVVSQRIGRKEAISLGKELIGGENVDFIYIDPILYNLSWEIFQSVKKKNVGFVDCSTLAAMQTHGVKKLLTFDKKNFSSLRKNFNFQFYV